MQYPLIGIRVSPSLSALLRDIASERGMTLSELLRHALLNELLHDKLPRPLGVMRQTVLAGPRQRKAT